MVDASFQIFAVEGYAAGKIAALISGFIDDERESDLLDLLKVCNALSTPIIHRQI